MNGGQTVSDLLQQGWRFYRAPKHSADGCEHLRTVESHIAEIVTALSQLVVLDRPVALHGLDASWPLVEQWLRMAAGLHFVDLDLHEFDPSFMCGDALDYEEAAGWIASQYATEYTRLLYTWSATELIVKRLKLPPVREAQGWLNGATLALKNYWEHRALPDHYAGVLRHLEDHIRANPDLSNNTKLVGALKETSWRDRSGLLLAASHQLRHVPAHGNLRIPEPDRWGEDARKDESSPSALHVPRLGIRGLLLGLQMVLVAILPSDLRLGDDFRGEWSVRDGDGKWIEVSHPLVKDVLMHVQLDPEGP